MNLDKFCTVCEKKIKTTDIYKVHKGEFLSFNKCLIVNCKQCHSTLLILNKKDQIKMKRKSLESKNILCMI